MKQNLKSYEFVAKACQFTEAMAQGASSAAISIQRNVNFIGLIALFNWGFTFRCLQSIFGWVFKPLAY
ncbi:hypothetical protein A4G18_09985 [Pasteurellaceae bacterium Pebbles2]|nr:hypothetical protein [Pasteurellaceae bacterium Pebbles2]